MQNSNDFRFLIIYSIEMDKLCSVSHSKYDFVDKAKKHVDDDHIIHTFRTLFQIPASSSISIFFYFYYYDHNELYVVQQQPRSHKMWFQQQHTYH